MFAGGCGGATPAADSAPAPAGTTPAVQTPTGGPSDSPSPSARSSGRSLAGAVVALDPGHNGGNGAHPEIINRQVDAGTLEKACDTTGAETNAGYAEAAFAFDVAKRLARRLRARGIRVVLTRKTNSGVGPCITRRAAIGNRANADAALSIHADGGPAGGRGFHVIEPASIPGYTAAIAPASHRLALRIRSAFRAGTGQPYATYIGSAGLDTRDDLGGLNLSTVPKIFVECGNIRNATDAARLSDPAFRERVAAALETGLVRFLRKHTE
ncbi:MAG: N-acetylmuramoyl-L-alanine amidase [Streptosporangiales bacterium]|nr:N-acetylmuramoyl-L-alanine amidase [Streptosporangiales bacterium]